MALVVFTPAFAWEITVVAAGLKETLPVTSQSPAGSVMLVTFAFVLDVRETAVPVAVRMAPTLPAAALLPVVFPAMPLAEAGVINPVGAIVVGVIAPKVKVMAGVDVGFATVPLTPLAVVTLTLVTEPPDAVAQLVFVPSVVRNLPLLPV